MHNKKLSQVQSKWLSDELRRELSLPVRDKLQFAQLTPSQVVERVASLFGASVDEEQVMVWARM